MLNTIKFYGDTSVAIGHYIDEHATIRWRENENKRIPSGASYHKALVGFKVDLPKGERLSLYISGPEFLVVPRIHIHAMVQARTDGVESNAPLSDVVQYVNTNLKSGGLAADLYSSMSMADLGAIASARRYAILNRFNEVLASGVHQGTKQSRESAAVEQVAIECGVSNRTVDNVLKYFDVHHMQVSRIVEDEPTKIDKKSPEYKMLRYQRTLADNKALQLGLPSKMKQENLLINGVLPIICPVLKIRLNYVDKDNTRSVRVWYKYPGKGLVDGNYCVMSKAAVDLISGKRLSPKRRDIILREAPDGYALWREWCEKYGTSYRGEGNE